MHRPIRAAGLAAVAVTALLSSAAVAQPAEARDDDGWRDTLTIGVGAAIAPSYDGSDNYVIIPSGVVRGQVSGFNFFARGPQIFVDVIRDKGDVDIELGPVAGLRLDRTNRIRDDRVRALGEIDTAVELGGFAGLGKTGVFTSDFDSISVRVAYVRDVADAHDSYVISPAIEYVTPLSKTLLVGASVSADIVGDGYASTYFDIDPAGSAASGLAPFDADGGLRAVSFGLLGGVSLSGDLRRGWSLFGIGVYSRLQGDFARSPIVSEAGSADQVFGGLGLAYTF